MNNYEQIIQQLIEAGPSWEKDGGGLRGRVLAPIISGTTGSFVNEGVALQQFSQQKTELIQQQDDRLPELFFHGGGGSVSQSHPFKIRSIQNQDNENQYIVTVYAGTLNNLLPSNLFSGGGLRQFPISANGLFYVVLDGETNGNDQFISCELSVVNTQPPPQQPTKFSLPTSPQFLLGIVFNGIAYNTIIDSLTVAGKQQFTTDKQPPAQAGELPYEIWYVWG